MKSVSKPLISVVMSVYNNRAFLDSAIRSVLNQTCRDFEFLITDDGSTDGSADVIDEFARRDDRIKIFHQVNTGLTVALNRMIAESRGEYIARMDADDISLPQRLEKQVFKLQEQPERLVVGTWYQVLDKNNMPFQEKIFPDNPRLLRQMVSKGINCYAHGSVMMRRTVFNDLGFQYRFKYGQDMDLWLRLSEHGTLGMVEEVLYKRRDHDQSISKAIIPQRAALMDVMLALSKERQKYGKEYSNWKQKESEVFNGVPLWTEKEIEAHNWFLEARRLICNGKNRQAREILSRLKNNMSQIYNLEKSLYISYLPGILTVPILKMRDTIKNKRHFVRILRASKV